MDENQVIWQELRTKQNNLDSLDERQSFYSLTKRKQFEDLQQKRNQLLYMMEGKYQMMQHYLGQVDVDTTGGKSTIKQNSFWILVTASMGYKKSTYLGTKH